MRLIDADALKDTLLKYNYTTAHNQIFRYIDEQQTAYDVDKVVEQLEEESYLVKPRGRSSTDYADTVVDIGEAIDIVKKGGVE